jgi:shikimate dehydrogenase
MINGMTKLLCLLGQPVEHSFSPAMHNAAFQKLKINSCYMAFDVDKNNLESMINGLKVMNFVGCNVTSPHKLNVIPFLDHIDDKAKAIGAINTIVNVNGRLIGYNTDVLGFIEPFHNLSYPLQSKKIAILGTGGAAMAAIVGFINEKVSLIDIFSRNKVKSEAFIADIKSGNTQLVGLSYDDLASNQQYDVVVNCTPLGMHPNEHKMAIEPKMLGNESTIFYDMIYNPAKTLFLEEAEKLSAKIINGLDMLVYQGIYALKLWYPEIDIDTNWTKEDVIKVLKDQNII